MICIWPSRSSSLFLDRYSCDGRDGWQSKANGHASSVIGIRKAQRIPLFTISQKIPITLMNAGQPNQNHQRMILK